MNIYIQTEGTMDTRKIVNYNGSRYEDFLKIEQVNVLLVNFEGKQVAKYKHRMKTLRKKLHVDQYYDQHFVVLKLIMDLVARDKTSTVYCDLEEIVGCYQSLKSYGGNSKYESSEVVKSLWFTKQSLYKSGKFWSVEYKKEKVEEVFKTIVW